MISSSRWRTGVIIPFLATGIGLAQPQLGRDKASVLRAQVDENTAIRFFYDPGRDYFHVPLVVRPVTEGDVRLNTAPLLGEGRTAYVSLGDMQQLVQALAHANLPWEESENVKALGPYNLIPLSRSMEILVISSKGTASVKLDPKRICKTLEPLDLALKTPRALWEFQLFRQGYGCKVPDFNYDAYPDH